MGRKRPTVEEDAEYAIDTHGLEGKSFPNGMPRLAQPVVPDGYDSTFSYVWYDGAYQIIWSDHSLTVETRHKLFSHWYPDRTTWDPLGAIKIELSSNYENTNQEAFDLAVRTQEDLMAEGEYVPIYIR